MSLALVSLASTASAQCPAWALPTAMEPLNGGVQSLAVYSGRLIVSGGYTSIGGTEAAGLAAFDGSAFTSMTAGRVGSGGQLALYRDTLYIQGGPVGSAGQMWTGNSWATWPGTGTLGGNNITVRSIHAAPRTGIFAEGSFVFAGGTSARHAIWDGSSWRPASTQWGPNVDFSNVFQQIRGVQEYKGRLYVAGDFGSIARGTAFNQNTAQSNGICIYDGTQWLPMPNGGVNGGVRDMVIFKDQLYLAGDFTATRDGTIALNRIARFDGTNYAAVGTGASSTVTSLCVADDGTGEKLFLCLASGALVRSDGSTQTFLPTLFGSPGVLAAYDPGFGAGVFVGGSGLRTNLSTQNGSGLIRWGPSAASTIDTDGDGLPDTWEENGVDGDCNGTIDLNLAALGANKLRKDIFVEVDSMIGRAPLAGTLDRVVGAFALAPVTNPNGVDGIDLRLIVDAADQSIPLQDFPNDWWDFHALKAQRFGNTADRASANRQAILDAKRRVFRYCIFANTYAGTGSSGLAELPGNDFMVTLGTFNTPGGTPNQQAATFMHEMGHTLGLYHGGHQIDWGNDRRYNYKPNYHSVMNYTWQLASRRPGWALDYSREPLPALNENALDEVLGIGGMLNAVTLVGPLPAQEAFEVGGVDWNRNGAIDNPLVTADINFLYGEDPPSPGDVLQGSEDWSRLKYNFRGTSGYASGQSPESTFEMDEMDSTLAAYIDGLYAPVCRADFDGDGFLTFEDFDAFVTEFEGGGADADFDGDGFLTFEDFDAFVAEFEGGC